MRSRALWMYGLIVGVAALAAGTSLAQEQAVSTEASVPEGVVTPDGQAEYVEPGVPKSVPAMEIFPLEPGTVFQPHYVGEDDGEDVTAGTMSLYSNTQGTFVVAPGLNRRFADDLSLVARPTVCRFRRLEFDVIGKVNPAGVGGPFTVNYALYTNCPSVAQTPEQLASILIASTPGQITFTTDDPARVIRSFGANGIAIPAGVATIWLAVTFSRDNAGIVTGAPAEQGFSCDIYDYPGADCNANFGGFPEHAYGAMNVQLFGGGNATTPCTEGHIGYRASRPTGPVFNRGSGVYVSDDIRLGVDSCNMIGFEVAVRGPGSYNFEIRPVCDAQPIPATIRGSSIPPGITETRILRHTFDPPVPLNQTFAFAMSVNSTTSGVVLTAQQACVGETTELLGIDGTPDCNQISPGLGIHGAMNLTILCAGAPPVGACCDMFFTELDGSAVCRQVPEMNCPFPPRFSNLRPAWVQGAACDPDPFVPGACGTSACCKPDDTCSNLTQAECGLVPPEDRPRQWQRGRFCSLDGQRCPFNACLGREGECVLARDCPLGLCGQDCRENGCPTPGCEQCPPIGCEDSECCTDVCLEDFYCCEIEWDDVCASMAAQICTTPPSNDNCAPLGNDEGARLLTVPDSEESHHNRATETPTDHGFSCLSTDPLGLAKQSVWYKFIAPPPVAPNTRSNVVVSTCLSNSPADDSLLEVFAVGDPTDATTQCQTLIPRGCNDDVSGCGSTGRNSRVCARDLIPGNIYYAVVAAKFAETSTTAPYRINTIQVANCPPTPLDDTNDFCDRAITITGAETPFDLGRANPPYTPDWEELCIPFMTKDLWFNYTATCTGKLTIDTCGASAATSPDTTLAVYQGPDCPLRGEGNLACNSDELGPQCGLASLVELNVIVDQPLKIRVGDSSGSNPAGNLSVSCVQSTCPAGFITLVEPPDEGGIPNGLLDAQRPHSPTSATPLEGIQTFKVRTTRDAQASCFTLCESAIPPAPNATSNSIQSVVQGPPGTYTITLARPITPGGKTRITYDPDGIDIATSHVYLYSHPGNVNDDNTVDLMDVLAMRDALEGIALPWGLYSGDVNRSFVNNPIKSSGITAADMLEVADLVNGAGQYPTFGSTPNPKNSPACLP